MSYFSQIYSFVYIYSSIYIYTMVYIGIEISNIKMKITKTNIYLSHYRYTHNTLILAFSKQPLGYVGAQLIFIVLILLNNL